MYTTTNNRVQLIGFLGAEVEIREYAEGKKAVRLVLATHDTRKNEHGQRETHTVWHNLRAWGKTAEHLSRFSKGQRLFIEGILDYQDHVTAKGEKKMRTVIEVTDFKRLEFSDQ